MIFLTHLLGGLVAVVYLGSHFGVWNDGRLIPLVAAAVFSALPDIDTVKSKLGRRLQPFSTIAAFVFRHRGFLHSFTFAGVAYLGMLYLSTQAIAAAAAIGYLSHLILDALTKEGIKPLSPLSKWKIRGFIRTGGVVEKIILASWTVMLLLRLA